MKNKVTNDAVIKFIKEIAEQVREERERERNLAFVQMLRIESNFLATLDKNQRETYYKLCEKQKLVYGLENN